MKKFKFLLMLCCLSIAFVGCDKEDHIMGGDVSPQGNSEIPADTDDEKTSDVVLDETMVIFADSVPATLRQDDKAVDLRSATDPIYNLNYTLRAGQWLLVYLNKNDLDPNCKYIAKVTSYNGDPDLFVYGRQGSGSYRRIRRASINGVIEETYAYLSDLNSHEDRLYFAVWADGNREADFKLEIFKDCNTGGCTNLPSNCQRVQCIPQVLTTNEGYRCEINATFGGDNQVAYWKVNGVRKESTSKTPGFTVTSPGTYTICCYFWCNGRLYVCCVEVVCPPRPETGCCTSDPLNYNWLQNIIHRLCNDNCSGEKIYCATYNGQPAIHITPWNAGCTDGVGYVYDCSGRELGRYGGITGSRLPGTLINGSLIWDSQTDCYNNDPCTTLRVENFEQYPLNSRIAARSPYWATWAPGREGGPQDGTVGTDRSAGTSKYLLIHNDKVQDVIYKLGNLNSGKYEITMRMKVHGSGYFNVQNDQNTRVGGGVMKVFFYDSGRYRIQTNGGGQSNLISYDKSRWINVKITADFDSRSFKIGIQGREFSVTSTRNFTALGALNFYAIERAHFLVDDIVLKRC